MRPSLIALIQEDYAAHGGDASKPGFRAIAVHRIGAWGDTLEGKISGKIVRLIARWLFRRVRNAYGIELPATAKIGRRVIIEHQGAIVVHGRSAIGDDSIIRQGVTLGNRRLAEPLAAPQLGKRVNVGAGAAILGGVMIGDDVNIGANAVVIHDVPSGATVVGPLARIALVNADQLQR